MRRKPDHGDLLACAGISTPSEACETGATVISFAEAAAALRRQIAIKKLSDLARLRNREPGDGGNAA